MIIRKSIDVENEIQTALSSYMAAYCRPLPKSYELPNILVTQVGGSDESTIDTFEVTLDSRAETEAEALDTLNTAVGVLRAVANAQTCAIRHIIVNSAGSWGDDPVRPDLAMCTARLQVVAHQEYTEV